MDEQLQPFGCRGCGLLDQLLSTRVQVKDSEPFHDLEFPTEQVPVLAFYASGATTLVGSLYTFSLTLILLVEALATLWITVTLD